MIDDLVVDIPVNSKGFVTENVYSVIKKNILHWRLKPGQRISEKEVADHLDVSRTPIRESFIRLNSEALLDIFPQRGTFISKIDLNIVEEGLFIRRSLETSVSKIAVDSLREEDLDHSKEIIANQEKAIKKKDPVEFIRYDDEFHKSLFVACNKEMTWEVMQNANTQYNRVRMLTLIDIDKFSTILDEHRKIISAIESKDTNVLIHAVNEHLEHLFIEEAVLKNKYPDYFL